MNTKISPSAGILLAFICACIGLASSYVTGQFFVAGLERLEGDSMARDALLASGVLMIVVELAAFGVSALLPRQAMRALRVQLVVCGLMLLAFEGVTIYVTQGALNAANEAASRANESRITSLRASIDNQQSTIQSLRESGARQSASANAWAQHLGAVALKDALKEEQKINAMRVELSTLESHSKPTITAILGADGTTYYSVARALLTSIMGLVMFAAAGSIWRESRGVISNEITPAMTPEPIAPMTLSPAPDYTKPGPAMRFATSTAFALAVLSPVAYAVTAPEAAPIPQDDHVAGDGKSLDARYERIKAGVKAGEIKPSVRGLMAAERMGTRVAGEYLERLGAEGIVKKARIGWEAA